MGSQDVSKWMARVAKDEVKNFAVDPDDFKPPKRL
jgi:hypothetical protein